MGSNWGKKLKPIYSSATILSYLETPSTLGMLFRNKTQKLKKDVNHRVRGRDVLYLAPITGQFLCRSFSTTVSAEALGGRRKLHIMGCRAVGCGIWQQ